MLLLTKRVLKQSYCYLVFATIMPRRRVRRPPPPRDLPEPPEGAIPETSFNMGQRVWFYDSKIIATSTLEKPLTK